jgi:hypothetical protein
LWINGKLFSLPKIKKSNGYSPNVIDLNNPMGVAHRYGILLLQGVVFF